jgi:hypothetical protein
LEKSLECPSGLESAERREVEEHVPALLQALTKSMPVELCILIFSDLETTVSKSALNGACLRHQASQGSSGQSEGSFMENEELSMHNLLALGEELLLRIAAELPAQAKNCNIIDLPMLSQLTAALAVFWDRSRPKGGSHSGCQRPDTDSLPLSPPWALRPEEKAQLIANLPQWLCTFLCGLPDEASRPDMIGACLVNLFRTQACKDEALLMLRRKLQRCVHR